MTAYTLTVFVNGTKGTDAVAVADAPTASPNLYVGSKNDGTLMAAAHFTDLDGTDVCLTDDEIAGWAA